MPRIAVVHKEKCNPVSCGGYLCMKLCPVNMQGEDCIKVGPDQKPIIDEVLCTGCGICPKRCPFGAIDIINLPQQLDKPPIHRYGQNGFHLYSLPIPVMNKVVGIIGRNGMGKSTAMKLLAGVFAPNLGQEKEASYEELMKFFKGTVAQQYFENVNQGKVTVSYKPQQVDLIPTMTDGNVRSLLESVDEKKELDAIAERLGITSVLDSTLNTLSGGELQRVAIAATVLKKANVYVFDEPTSFLDIKQRLLIANFIKELADEHTAVLVVEHDLVILDAMTDVIHIMYGKPLCYGVSSLSLSAKRGINAFLEGYVKEENMRFRQSAIHFLEKPPVITRTVPTLTSWKDIEVDLGSFSLKAGSGELKKNEVVGVLGENGIGKTTFVKVLAQALEPSKGSLDKKVKVSYKPQHLKASDDLVSSVVAHAVEKFHAQLIQPLDIEPLMNKELSTLSGGELQRVAICAALGADADLFLLDEPSAYLDVEQRLNVSKVIRDFLELTEKTVLVVDHDIVFVDYISDRLMVFTGTPAKEGVVNGPFEMEEGMNMFLQSLNISLRRDEESKRPRMNKEGSVKDREQKSSGNWYYS